MDTLCAGPLPLTDPDSAEVAQNYFAMSPYHSFVECLLETGRRTDKGMLVNHSSNQRQLEYVDFTGKAASDLRGHGGFASAMEDLHRPWRCCVGHGGCALRYIYGVPEHFKPW